LWKKKRKKRKKKGALRSLRGPSRPQRNGRDHFVSKGVKAAIGTRRRDGYGQGGLGNITDNLTGR
jgi:hypothetical protein